MRDARDCLRGLRRMAIYAALGLKTIRLDAQRIDALAEGASRAHRSVAVLSVAAVGVSALICNR